MESVGQKLRQARLRKNLGLEDLSAVTKINVRTLQAIEADEVSQISSPFTYRSFARQFAAGVSLPWPEIEAGVSALSGLMPTPLVPGEPGSFVPPNVPGLKPKRTQRLRWAVSLTSLGLMLGVCSSFHAAWQDARVDFRGTVNALENSFHKRRAEAKAAPVSDSASVPATPTVTASSHEPANLAAAANPTPAPAPESRTFRIELSALENCWLSVVTDGREVFSGVLQPSQSKVLDGHEEARIRAGNAGGVEVNFNGRELGTLGRRGEVRTVVFTKNGYEVLQPAAQVRFELAAFLATHAGE